jgi:chromosome segregation ATPase
MTPEQRENIESQIARQTAELALYQEKISEQSVIVDAAYAPIATRESAVADLQSQIDTLTGEIAELRPAHSEARAVLDALQSNAGVLETAILGCRALL